MTSLENLDCLVVHPRQVVVAVGSRTWCCLPPSCVCCSTRGRWDSWQKNWRLKLWDACREVHQTRYTVNHSTELPCSVATWFLFQKYNMRESSCCLWNIFHSYFSPTKASRGNSCSNLAMDPPLDFEKVMCKTASGKQYSKEQVFLNSLTTYVDPTVGSLFYCLRLSLLG